MPTIVTWPDWNQVCVDCGDKAIDHVQTTGCRVGKVEQPDGSFLPCGCTTLEWHES